MALSYLRTLTKELGLAYREFAAGKPHYPHYSPKQIQAYHAKHRARTKAIQDEINLTKKEIIDGFQATTASEV